MKKENKIIVLSAIFVLALLACTGEAMAQQPDAFETPFQTLSQPETDHEIEAWITDVVEEDGILKVGIDVDGDGERDAWLYFDDVENEDDIQDLRDAMEEGFKVKLKWKKIGTKRKLISVTKVQELHSLQMPFQLLSHQMEQDVVDS